jgi:ubiquitin-protein ligase
MQELHEMQTDPPAECSAGLASPDNVREWDAMIVGPGESPYVDGAFFLRMTFPPDYPFSPPHVRFITPIYHPNISEHGDICLSTLSQGWSSCLSVRTILLSVSSLMTDPNPSSALRHDVASLLYNEPDAFEKRARAMTRAHAM